MRKLHKNRLQTGLTLLEVIVSLGLLSSVFLGAVSLIDNYSSNMKNNAVGQHTSTFGQAMKAYVKDNYAAVVAIATPTTPALIRVSTLVGSGKLQNGFNTSNGYGQTVCGLVLEPIPGQLTALVVNEGGTAINDVDLGQIAGVIGAAGGGIYSSAATTLRGTMGGWSMPIGNYANANQAGLRCNGTAGAVSLTQGHPVMALWFSEGDTTAGVLYRDSIPGQPQLNQMNTPIIMSSEQTIGSACTTTGAIARDSVGSVISCQGSVWKKQGSSFWEDPVLNNASLPTCNASIAWQTRVVRTPTVGSGPRAFTCDGTSWKALAVDENGNLTVPGIITVGKTQISDVVTEGTACASNGLVARDATGLILSCQSGVWRKLESAWSRSAAQCIANGYVYTGGACQTIRTFSGAAKFGGSYSINSSGACAFVNSVTGSCSCPSGYGYSAFGVGPYQSIYICQAL